MVRICERDNGNACYGVYSSCHCTLNCLCKWQPLLMAAMASALMATASTVEHRWQIMLHTVTRHSSFHHHQNSHQGSLWIFITINFIMDTLVMMFETATVTLGIAAGLVAATATTTAYRHLPDLYHHLSWCSSHRFFKFDSVAISSLNLMHQPSLLWFDAVAISSSTSMQQPFPVMNEMIVNQKSMTRRYRCENTTVINLCTKVTFYYIGPFVFLDHSLTNNGTLSRIYL